MKREPIRTPRLRLVPSGVEHADAVWAAVEASLPELRPWMAWAVDDTHEHTVEYLKMCEKRWNDGEGWTFCIFLDDEIVGTVGLEGYEPLQEAAEVGYWIRSDVGGRGLMTEAAAAVVTFGFEKAGLHSIQLRAGIANAKSIRVAEKLGFRRVGVLRSGGRGENGWHDSYLFDLLESDERPALRPE